MVANASKIINGKVLIFEEYYVLAPKGVGYPATLKKVVKVHEPRFVPVAQVKTAIPAPPKGFKRGVCALTVADLEAAMKHYGVKSPSMTMSAVIDHVRTNTGFAVAIWDLGKDDAACLKIKLEQNQPYDTVTCRIYRINRK